MCCGNARKQLIVKLEAVDDSVGGGLPEVDQALFFQGGNIQRRPRRNIMGDNIWLHVAVTFPPGWDRDDVSQSLLFQRLLEYQGQGGGGGGSVPRRVVQNAFEE